jgi:anti-sigma factor (TIGR02949 family)
VSRESEGPDAVECDRLLELLQDHLKGELEPAAVSALEAHLERCAPCFRSATFERNFIALLSGKHAAAARCPETLRSRVLAAVRASGPG